MKWRKREIDNKDLESFYMELTTAIKSGTENLDHLYCTFLSKDINIIKILTIFDFIDSYNNHLITADTISNLVLRQSFKEN